MQRQALLFVRLIALAGLAINLHRLAANLLQTYDTFNPSYIGYYWQQQLARPVIGLVLCALLALFSRPLSRLISRGTDE